MQSLRAAVPPVERRSEPQGSEGTLRGERRAEAPVIALRVLHIELQEGFNSGILPVLGESNQVAYAEWYIKKKTERLP